MKLLIDPTGDEDLPGMNYVKMLIQDRDHLEGWLHENAIEELKTIVALRGGTVEVKTWVKDEIDELHDFAESLGVDVSSGDDS